MNDTHKQVNLQIRRMTHDWGKSMEIVDQSAGE